MWSLSTRESLNKSEETETIIWEAYGSEKSKATVSLSLENSTT